MSDECRKIGILGGTFNPIHYGHLIIAETVREEFGLDRVLFIPSGTPPHKQDCDVEDAGSRFEMVRCAVCSNPFFEASRMEIDRAGYTYTVDTLKALRAEYGKGASLFFIIGADVIHELTTWKSYAEVFGLCEFIAVKRPGFSSEAFMDAMAALRRQYGVSIHTVEAPLIDISSSGIREYVKLGRSIRYLTPQCVEEYIKKNGLYRT